MARGVEIHIPISPTESFFQQVHYLLESLRQNGGRLRDAPVIVTVGEDCEPFDIARRLSWSRDYPVEFRWIPRQWYQQEFATGLDRFRHVFREPWVLFLDADMVFARDIDDLLDRAAADPAVYALPDHGSPFQNSGLLDIHSDEEWWRLVFESAGLPEPVFESKYSGVGVLSGVPPRCPPYFSFATVLAPAEMMTTLGSTIHHERQFVDNVVTTFWRAQVALTLATIRHHLPWRAVPLRCNFPPTLRWYLPLLQEEWDDVRIIHYSSYKRFNINLLMENPAAMEDWLRENSCDPIEQDFRELLRELHFPVSLSSSPEPWYSAEHCHRFPAGRPLTLEDIQLGWTPPRKLIRNNTKVLAIGRHFSEELAPFLSGEGYNQWQLPFAPHLHPGGNMVKALWRTFEDIFFVLQHFQWAVGEFTPHSRLWYTTERSLFDPTHARRETICSSLKEAEVCLITLHTSELWVDRVTNQPAWRAVSEEQQEQDRFVFRRATVAETLSALYELDQLIDRHRLVNQFILALSPTTLETTVRDESPVTATQASKSILKAAIDQFISDPSIAQKGRYHYFPSYEIAWYLFDHPFLPESTDLRPEVNVATLNAFREMYTDLPLSGALKMKADSFQTLQSNARNMEKQLVAKEAVIHDLDLAARERLRAQQLLLSRVEELERSAEERLRLIDRLTWEIGERDSRLAEVQRAAEDHLKSIERLTGTSVNEIADPLKR